MSFYQLANELLLLIADNFDSERDINAFARVNRKIHTVVNPYLYKHNIRHFHGSAMLWAAEKGRIETVKYLLGHGADILACYDSSADDAGEGPDLSTPLTVAVMFGHEDVLALLLETGVDPNYDRGCEMLLHAAAARGNIRIVELCLEKGADVNTKDYKDETALVEAVQARKYSMIDYLLSRGADPDEPGGGLGPPLHIAACDGWKEGIELLLKYGADINKRDLASSTPLDSAMFAKERMLKFLQEKGAISGWRT